MRRELDIGGRKIGDNNPCYVCFEAGPTHDGLETALQLVDASVKAGADAIKFQIVDADRLVSDKSQPFRYSILKNKELGILEEVEEPLFEILKRRQLCYDEWRQVKQVCDQSELAFFATICFEEDLELLAELKCHSVKIASADLNHYPLLRLAARSGMNVQIDTGNSTIIEVEKATQILESEGCSSIIVHQCPSGYPARLPSICLRMIKTLRNRFVYPIAYSDHTPEADMDIAAVALGANMIEKTITLDKSTPSVEHCFSLEPQEMKEFINRIRDLEVALGEADRVLTVEQIAARKAVRRSVFAKSPASVGTALDELQVEFRRPGTGISPARWEELVDENHVLVDGIKATEMITREKIDTLN